MKLKTVEYYDWSSIQEEICKDLDITVSRFRSRFWSIFIDICGLRDITNGHISNLSHITITPTEDRLSEHSEHAHDFIRCLYNVFNKYDIVSVKFYW